MKEYRCMFCERPFTNKKSIGPHTKWYEKNPNRQVPFKNYNIKGRKGTNPGLSPSQWMSKEGYRRSKEKLKEAGGSRNGGKGKRGWYKGIWCDSSWELAWLIFSNECGELPKRNQQKFEYRFKGETRKWKPDFIMPNGVYVEIKGWFVDSTFAKIEQFQKPLIVLTWNELENIICYIIKKYGQDFIQLYEERKS